MNRQPVPSGTQINLHCCATVGQDGSLAGVAVDWSATAGFVKPGAGNAPATCNDGVGTFERDGLVFDVYVDLDGGQLWYDADKGWC